ncbi:hypothetical protein C3E97_001125 [Pseudomonas sp. MWU12-2115]|nr:hypothetical protein C3E97_001125 [Pseudomonas sp. MWU12-2115]
MRIEARFLRVCTFLLRKSRYRQVANVCTRRTSFPDVPISPCGSGLARESGVSVETALSDTTPSRASPLPQGQSAAVESSVYWPKPSF